MKNPKKNREIAKGYDCLFTKIATTLKSMLTSTFSLKCYKNKISAILNQ